MSKVDYSHSHEVMEQIKIRVVLDGDLAATISNAIMYCYEQGVLDSDIVFCGHTKPKLEAFMDHLQKEMDIKQREET
jgi:hypothetical protein